MTLKARKTISASTSTEGQKVTLTLYRTQKLLIQGVGAKLWKSTEFQKLSFMFNQSENQNLITDGVNEQTPSRKQPTIVHETPFHGAGLGGSVGYAVRLETRRSRVQPPPRSVTFSRGD